MEGRYDLCGMLRTMILKAAQEALAGHTHITLTMKRSYSCRRNIARLRYIA